MKKIISVLTVVVLLTSCKHKGKNSFFNTLSMHCGKTYIGKTVFPDNPTHDFAGKKLVMHVAECSDTEIRIPFKVGEDTSRTWIISKTPQGLLLKHDHRHADGTPDEITMYGGYADTNSNATTHNFVADAYTAKLLPEAKTNVWTLSFDNNNTQFSYYLKRHNKPRYKAIFAIL